MGKKKRAPTQRLPLPRKPPKVEKDKKRERRRTLARKRIEPNSDDE